MNQFAFNQSEKPDRLSCGDLAMMAEQEFAAFFRTVTELFGLEEAKIAAEDWLHEMMAIDELAINDLAASIRQWRLLTVKVAVRLASRVNVSFGALAAH